MGGAVLQYLICGRWTGLDQVSREKMLEPVEGGITSGVVGHMWSYNCTGL